MKKAVLILMMAALMLGSGVSSVFAEKVGDPMPRIKGLQLMEKNQIPSGKGIMVHLHKAGRCTYNVLYMICDGKVVETPVGICDLQTGTLYLDNAPNDGRIDAIHGMRTMPGLEDSLPECE